MKNYEKFTEQEIKTILDTSNTYEEALTRLEYADNTANRKIIRQLSLQFNVSIEHFINKQTKNLLGQRFGRLIPIRKVPNKRNGARWRCQCDCGNIVEVDANHLTRLNIQSCGCLQKEKISEYNKTVKLQDLTGQRFGKLTVLYRAENIGEQPSWICQCDCGEITHPIMGGNLKSGQTKSCGCLVSAGEAKIKQLLMENNINYQTQVKFVDCISDKNAELKFDFGVYDNNNTLLYLIEYQGIQHYYETTWTHDSLQQIQERDQIKVEYCKNNKIPLLIIPYTKFSTLNIKDLQIKENEKL